MPEYKYEAPQTPSQRHYAANRRKRITASRLRARRNRGIIDDYKRLPCRDCGGRYPAHVMDLDHVEPRNGAVRPSQMLTYSEARLREELAKCVVRCANCHRLRHTGELGRTADA